MAHPFALKMQNHQKLADEQFLQQKQLFQLFSVMVPAQQAPILNLQPSVYPQAPLLPFQYNLHLQNEQTNFSQQNRAPTTGSSVSMVNVGDYCSNTSDLVGNDASNLNKAQSGEKMVLEVKDDHCLLPKHLSNGPSADSIPCPITTPIATTAVNCRTNAINSAAVDIPLPVAGHSLIETTSNNGKTTFTETYASLFRSQPTPPAISIPYKKGQMPAQTEAPPTVKPSSQSPTQEPGLSVAPANYQITANITACTQPVTVPIPLPTTHSPLVQPSHSTKSKSVSNSVESYVPCTDLNQNQCHPTLSNSATRVSPPIALNNNITPSPTSNSKSIGSSTSGSYYIASKPQHFTRSRLSNEYSPLSGHILEDVGESESWEQSSDDHSLGYLEDINDSYGYYSAAEKADAEFAAAIGNNANEECCIQLEQCNTLDQHFPPLAVTAASPSCTSVPPIHIPTPKSGGSEYSPSPIKTRALRKKQGPPYISISIKR
ncbi:hypothetical protein LguiA_006725 [Lonicera macranthoides]